MYIFLTDEDLIFDRNNVLI